MHSKQSQRDDDGEYRETATSESLQAAENAQQPDVRLARDEYNALDGIVHHAARC